MVEPDVSLSPCRLRVTDREQRWGTLGKPTFHFLPLTLLPSTHTAGHPHTERGREGREKSQGNQHIYNQLYSLHTQRGRRRTRKKTHTHLQIFSHRIQKQKRVWQFSEGLLPASDKRFTTWRKSKLPAEKRTCAAEENTQWGKKTVLDSHTDIFFCRWVEWWCAFPSLPLCVSNLFI